MFKFRQRTQGPQHVGGWDELSDNCWLLSRTCHLSTCCVRDPSQLSIYWLYWASIAILRSMNPTAESTAFNRAVSPVLRQVLPQQKVETAINFDVDPDLRARIEELASKSTEGDLSDQERLEYQGYVRANKFIATLRRQARRLLNPVSQ